VLADLLSRRGQIDADAVVLTTERDTLAYSALAGGDARARKKLEELNKQLARLRDDEAALSAAVVTAQSMVRDAEEALRDAQRVDNGIKALALLDPLKTAGQTIDAAIGQLLQGLDQLRSDVRQLRAWGCHPTSEQSMQVAIRRALESALQAELDVPLHRPAERRDFSDLCRLWGENCLATLRTPDRKAA